MVFELYSFVQVVLEMIPVSSSGNNALLSLFFEYFFYCKKNIHVFEIFDFILQWPTIIVVGLFFMRPWLFYLKNGIQELFLCIFQRNKKEQYSFLYVTFLGYILFIDMITVCFYFFLKYTGTDWWPLWLGFLCTSICLYATKQFFCVVADENKNNAVTLLTRKQVVFLGCAQSFALLPGVSRLGITFLTGKIVGFSSRKAFEYSFLIEWPLLVAAGCKGIIQLAQLDLLEYEQILSWPVLFSTLIATGVSYYVIRFSLSTAVSGTWWRFSLYTVLCCLAAIVMTCEKTRGSHEKKSFYYYSDVMEKFCK